MSYDGVKKRTSLFFDFVLRKDFKLQKIPTLACQISLSIGIKKKNELFKNLKPVSLNP